MAEGLQKMGKDLENNYHAQEGKLQSPLVGEITNAGKHMVHIALWLV